LSAWQDKIKNNKSLDDSTKKNIIGLETDVSTIYSAYGGQFALYMVNRYKENGDLTTQDLISAFSDFYNTFNERVSGVIKEKLDRITNSGAFYARKQVKDDFKKEGFLRTGARDRYLDEAIGRSLNKVVTVGDDIINDIRDKFVGQTTLDTHDIVRTLIEEEKDRIEERFTGSELKKAMQGVWGKYRYILERIVRTETMGAFTRVQLKTWFDMGIKEVTRHAVNDNRTCEICKQICKPGNRFLIEDLLKLDNPLIEDPDNPGELLTHPNCRDWFTPIYDTTKAELSYYNLFGEDPDFKSAEEVKYKHSLVKSVPIDYRDSIENILREVQPEKEMYFVNDVTNDPMWKKMRVTELKASGLSDSGIIDALTKEIEAKYAHIVQYENLKKEIGFGVGTSVNNRVSHLISRVKAFELWDGMDSNLKKFVEDRYLVKKMEEGFTLEDQGIQIYGGQNFITSLAGENSRLYFAETYGFYTSNPVLLRGVDSKIFDFLKKFLFKGRSFYGIGGIV